MLECPACLPGRHEILHRPLSPTASAMRLDGWVLLRQTSWTANDRMLGGHVLLQLPCFNWDFAVGRSLNGEGIVNVWSLLPSHVL